MIREIIGDHEDDYKEDYLENALIRRGLEVLATEGLKSFLVKAFRTVLVRTVNPWAASKYGTNSKRYWDTRLRFAWDQVGGNSQTLEFAEAMKHHIHLDHQEQIKTVLDFGCATGDSVPVLNAMFGPASIFLHDLSDVGVANALKKYQDFAPAKWDQESKVDFVYCSNVIEHILDPTDFVRGLTDISELYVVIQCPWEEYGPAGQSITPQDSQGEHIWTIDKAFLDRHLPLDGWSWLGKLADVPGAWPFGKQLLLLGTKFKSGDKGALVLQS